MSNPLRPHGLQHTRPPYPSPTAGVHPNPCPLSQWCHPLSPPSPPPFNFPSIRVFSKESALRMRWPKYWSFSFNISPSNEHPGLISFRMDWLDLLAVQGALKSLLQHHSSKASSLWCSAFSIVQLSHPYMTIGKTTALTRWTFVGKVMSLLFNMLSRLVITFLPMIKWSKMYPIILFQAKYWRWRNEQRDFFERICRNVVAFPLYISYKKGGKWLSLFHIEGEFSLIAAPINWPMSLKVIGEVGLILEQAFKKPKDKKLYGLYAS